MNTPLNCLTCGATFHQYNLKQKYCSATCRNKALYANRKHQLAKVQQLSLMTEQLVCSQERVKDLETQINDLKQLEQENEVLRATIQQLTVQPTPSIYHIELRKMSITQVLDQPFVRPGLLGMDDPAVVRADLDRYRRRSAVPSLR